MVLWHSLLDIMCCPRCNASLLTKDLENTYCSDPNCIYFTCGFPVISGQPVLIDFENSIFDPAPFTDGRGSVLPRDDTGRNWRTKLKRLISGENPIAPVISERMIAHVMSMGSPPRILVIGGGAIGSGTNSLYANTSVQVVGTDVYASYNTHFVVDGHHLPFREEVFDGVWIQAVLEHVLNPGIVAEEIHRVLKVGGVVYADTPFMQQVHEGAYDFTRFTLSGHRWLFRKFQQIEAGAVGGTGTATIWSIRYLLRALGLGGKAATLLILPFFWLRFLDRFTRRRPNADGASGVYFYGIKSGSIVSPKDMVAYYETQK